jgi:hypothetical protein
MSTKSEIEAFLPELGTALRRLAKRGIKLASAYRDREKFSQTIAATEEGDYSDTAAIQALATTRQQLEICERTIARLEEEQGEAAEPLKQLVTEGARLVSRVLMPIFERRLETIAAVLEPFCLDKASAVALARQTNSATAAFAAICRFSQLPQGINSSPTEKVLAAASAIEAVLAENSKSAPDLLKFFDVQPAPAAPLASAESEKPAAVAAEDGGAQ